MQRNKPYLRVLPKKMFSFDLGFMLGFGNVIRGRLFAFTREFRLNLKGIEIDSLHSQGQKNFHNVIARNVSNEATLH